MISMQSTLKQLYVANGLRAFGFSQTNRTSGETTLWQMSLETNTKCNTNVSIKNMEVLSVKIFLTAIFNMMQKSSRQWT